MSETHINYEVSKRLKEFLGESAPTPMVGFYWRPEDTDDIEIISFINFNGEKTKDFYPAYQLHYLLSKPFLMAFRPNAIKKLKHIEDIWTTRELGQILAMHYYDAGLPAVEKALCEMMEDK